MVVAPHIILLSDPAEGVEAFHFFSVIPAISAGTEEFLKNKVILAFVHGGILSMTVDPYIVDDAPH